jgi:Predicted membrane protein
MEFNFLFVLNSVLFGIGLAMDAFSVSLANGLYEPKMSLSRMFRIAGTFALFQTVMPLLGWVCVHTAVEAFQSFDRLIPWIALALLLFLGIRMILEGVRGSGTEQAASRGWGLFLQGIATSIDALSVGFTIAGYDLILAVTESFIIGAITLLICLAGIAAGKKIGTRVSGKASVFGGVILILIGVEIFLQGVI